MKGLAKVTITEKHHKAVTKGAFGNQKGPQSNSKEMPKIKNN